MLVYLVYFSIKGLRKLREIKEREKSKNTQEGTQKAGLALEPGEEDQTQESVDEPKADLNLEQVQELDAKEKKYAKLCFIFAGVYLIVDWVLALISGLL